MTADEIVTAAAVREEVVPVAEAADLNDRVLTVLRDCIHERQGGLVLCVAQLRNVTCPRVWQRMRDTYPRRDGLYD